MATVIGDLAVRVGADTTGLSKGLVKGKSSLRQFNRDVKSGAATIGKLTAAVGAATAAVAVFANQSLQATKETANLARLAGTSVSNFQKMAFATRDVGVEQDKLADILKDTQDRVGDFLSTGGGPMADFFENIAPKVGVTAEQFRKLSGPDALQLYVSSLEKANLSQSEMTFYMEAMASDASALLPLLKDGGAAMLEQAKQAERLGLALSDMDAAKMEDAAEAMDDIGRLMTGFRDHVTAEISPLITALGKQFIGLTEDAGGVDEVVSNAFNNVVGAIANVINGLDHMDRALLQSQTAVDTFALMFRMGLLEVAREIVDIPRDAINQLIMAINEVPGLPDMDFLEMNEFSKDLTATINSTKAEIKTLNDELQNELSQPLAGNQLEKFHSEALQAAEDSAAARLEVEKSADEKAITAKQAAFDRMLEQRRTFFEMEREMNAEYRGVERDVEKEAQEQKFQRLQNMMRNELDIKRSGYDGLVNVAKESWGAEEGIMVDALGSMVNSLGTQNKKMFELSKAAGIANAIVSTYTAAAKALEAGPFIGPALAAATIASGFAKVAAIKSQTFQGGGSSSGGAASGGGGAQAQAQTQDPQRSVNVDISLIGADSRDRAVAGSVVEQINEAAERGERINRIALG